MSAVETLRAFVNAWDCDENDHLNVQFYFGFFETAAEHFLALSGVTRMARRQPLARHVRYHRELRTGQLVRMDSHIAPAREPERWHLVHRLSEPATGKLAATALDTYDGEPPAAPAGEISEEAAPRSLHVAPADIAELDSRCPPIAHRGRLNADAFDERGHVRHQALVARFSDAAGHFWEGMGATQPWLAENNYGRVALEMKVTRGATGQAGLVEVGSGPLATGNKTVSFFHVVRAGETGEVLATGEVTGLLFDRDQRRALPLPEAIRAKVEAGINS